MYLCEENLFYDIMRKIQVKQYVTLSHVKFGNIVHHPTLTRGCIKVHGGVPIVLCLFGDPL